MTAPMMYTKGEQSPDDPMEYIMSAQAVDRMGDEIVQAGWQLADFKRNPIALFAHNHSQPIGVWEQVRVEGERLMGRLRLARAGTSDAIDTIRSLVEQRILKAVSVGFMPLSWEDRRDKDNNWIGYRFLKSALNECSLVSVPAHPQALSTAKSFGLDERAFNELFLPQGAGQIAAPIDLETKQRETGMTLAKIERSLRTIGDMES